MANVTSNFSYLDMLAEIGYARHIGGRKATDRLIAAAGIGKDSNVLDVGCGMGRTSCRLAAEVGCRVTGLDIMPRMVEQARLLAKKMNLRNVRFLEGDARKLPFADGSFDVVLVESVTIFVEDVARAIAEYRRVARPGGVVCDNEVCITSQSREELANDMADLEAVFVAFSSKTDRGILTFEDWGDLYRGQFPAVEATHFVVEPGEETMAKKEDGSGSLVSMAKAAYLYYSNPEARAIIDTTRNMYKYVGHFGYGLFVCRK